jgi:hypothetical protein
VSPARALLVGGGAAALLLALGQVRPDAGAVRAPVAPKAKVIFDLLERVNRRQGEEHFDVASLVARVGRDPELLFAWVRDRTAWVPYAGTLRGAAGVLVDRLGNSLDRALLLSEMLRAAGGEARLVRGTLDDATLARVLDEFRGAPSLRRDVEEGAADDALDAEVGRALASLGIGPDELRTIDGRAGLERDRVAEEAVEGVAEQVASLGRALPRPSVPEARKAEAVASEVAREHWWVEVKRGATWVALDPTRREAQPGVALAEAHDRLVATPEGEPVLPDGSRHELRVAIVAEQWSPSGPRESKVVETTVRPSECLGDAIEVLHVPAEWPSTQKLFEAEDPAAGIVAAALAQTSWLPVLVVGSKVFQADGVRDDGALDRDAAARLAKSLGIDGAARRVGDILRSGAIGGDVGGHRGGHEPEVAGVFSAEWIEFEIRTPGRATRTLRRPVFDLVGPAARAAGNGPSMQLARPERLRRALALVGSIQILPAPCQFSLDFAAARAGANLLGNRKTIEAGLAELDGARVTRAIATLSSLATFPADLHAFAVQRAALSRLEEAAWFDSIDVFSMRRSLECDAHDALSMLCAVDLVANGLAFRLPPDADRFLAHVEQGVLDTGLEAALVRQCGEVSGASATLRSALATGAGWTVVAAPDDPRFAAVALTPDARARIEADVRAGFLAAIPGRSASETPVDAWYRVDPRSGETLGMTARGLGGAWRQTATETVLLRAYQAVVLIAAGVCFYDRAVKNPEPPTKDWPTGQDAPPDIPQQQRAAWRGGKALVRCGLVAAIALAFPPSGAANRFWKLTAALMGLLW